MTGRQLQAKLSAAIKEGRATPAWTAPPAAVAKEALRGLTLRATMPRSRRGGTAVGLQTAKDLIARRPLSMPYLVKIRGYFPRHAVDSRHARWGLDSKGWQAWLLWGGDAGWEWASNVIARVEAL